MSDVAVNGLEIVFGTAAELSSIPDSFETIKAQEIELYDRAEIDSLLSAVPSFQVSGDVVVMTMN